MKKPAIFAMLCLLLVLPLAVAAGGWATLTLDNWPAKVVAGQPLTIGFTTLQHGQTPLNTLTPTVTAVHQETGERVTATAEREGAPGHYTATFTLPKAGRWNWSIQGFIGIDYPMPALQVAAPSATAAAATVAAPSTARAYLPPVLLLTGLLGAALSLLLWQRTRQGTALAAGLSLLLLAGVGAAMRDGPAETAVAQVETAVLTPAELGETLFVAKGCIGCHRNGRVDVVKPGFTVDAGPNLTHYQNSPEFLQGWLADPQAVKPGTAMPNLGLADGEIEALIAFLNETN